MPTWQLCANLLIPNRLCYNISYSLSGASEPYVRMSQSRFFAAIITTFYITTIFAPGIV